MFDSLFNFVIILIPLAIFIGRIVVQARNRRNPPPPPPQIPVHFVDDDEDEGEFIPHTLSRGAPELRKTLPKKHEALTPSPVAAPRRDTAPPVSVAAASPKAPPTGRKTGAVSPGKSFPLNLNNLSPLKQAVVMAEILGTPKGMM